MIRRPPISTLSSSSAASDVYKIQEEEEDFPQSGDPKGPSESVDVEAPAPGEAPALTDVSVVGETPEDQRPRGRNRKVCKCMDYKSYCGNCAGDSLVNLEAGDAVTCRCCDFEGYCGKCELDGEHCKVAPSVHMTEDAAADDEVECVEVEGISAGVEAEASAETQVWVEVEAPKVPAVASAAEEKPCVAEQALSPEDLFSREDDVEGVDLSLIHI
eukprot:TRINITY_DN22474_c0_g1_i2.p1 TRINITY_DN22474_c0_g1~~TRINITY_DN22474_c0_g1_i2.p1  ORF type:complete len:215 (-),score=59.83 TRINITY_DN22474_c0_g1_i2:129-773(-)